jgi:hypothetical protein
MASFPRNLTFIHHAQGYTFLIHFICAVTSKSYENYYNQEIMEEDIHCNNFLSFPDDDNLNK